MHPIVLLAAAAAEAGTATAAGEMVGWGAIAVGDPAEAGATAPEIPGFESVIGACLLPIAARARAVPSDALRACPVPPVRAVASGARAASRRAVGRPPS